jgi:hypothetical protein
VWEIGSLAGHATGQQRNIWGEPAMIAGGAR